MKLVQLLGITLIASVSSMASAIDWTEMLLPEEEDRLSPEARAIYDEAWFFNDRAALDETVRLLAEAAALAPGHVELQFLLLKRARNRADVYFSAAKFFPVKEGMDYATPPHQTAEPYFDIADAAIQRLNANPTLNSEQRRRLEAATRNIEEERANLAARDNARFETAFALVEEIRTARLEINELNRETADPLDPFQAYALGVNPRPDTDDAATSTRSNPFALLPGEVIAAFLPPPPAPQQGFGGGFNEFGPPAQQFDEFGNPIAPAPGGRAGFGPGFEEGF
jgi:hypothetical protein